MISSFVHITFFIKEYGIYYSSDHSSEFSRYKYYNFIERGRGFIVILGTILLISIFMDIIHFKIKNWWILVGFLGGMGYAICQGSRVTLLESFAGMIIGLFVLIPLYAVKAIGAGDVKLFCVISIFLSPAEYLKCMLAAIIIAALIGALLLLLKLFRKAKISLSNPTKIHFTIPIFISFLLLLGGIY